MIENYDRQGEVMNMVCDECTSNEHFDGTWGQCIAEARRKGWLITKVIETYLHFCRKECLEKWFKKNMKDAS